MQRVIVDANVLVSFFIERNTAQRAAARALLTRAENGEITAVITQSVVFEVAYVVQSQYDVTGDRLATVVRATTTFPGAELVDECPWKRVLRIWPDPLPGLADAAIIAAANASACDAVATFDRKLANKLQTFGLTAYF